MECSTAIDFFKTENVDAETEIRKAKKGKRLSFFARDSGH